MEVEGDREPHVFTFDRIFDQTSENEEIFKEVGIPTVDNVLAGFSSSAFAIGHWGHGKNDMTLGTTDSQDNWGVAPRMVQYLFDCIAKEESTLSPPPRYTVTGSCLEIYNETISDLLVPDSKNLELKKDSTGRTYVEGLKTVKLESGGVFLSSYTHQWRLCASSR